ncbi:MAG TPA: hypothetical protein VGJ21_10300 [Terracidiphilus sp.]|jgi:hypothetical protein
MSIPVKWLPIELAARMRTLQQGLLSVGNTQQNLLHLTALAKAEANSPTTGWARWNPAQPYKLQVQQRLVPGYVAPAGSGYANVPGIPPFTMVSRTNGINVGYQNGTLPLLTGGSSGSLTPNLLFGSIVDAVVFSGDGAQNVYVIVGDVVPQNFFTSLSFIDRGSNLETYLSAAATFTQSSGAHSIWNWLSQYPGHNSPWTATNTYGLTFS